MFITVLLFCICIQRVEAVFKRYVPRCPAYGIERFLQAEAVCGSTQEYHCLYDDDWKIAELCQSYKQIPSGNYPRYSSYGDDIYYDKCRSAYYQLGPVKSYKFTDCLFIKSKCSSEGQIPCSDGTTKIDVTCRCDYKNGYAMINVGCCSPTLFDDCTCYKKSCPEGQELDPGYNCVIKCPEGYERKDGEQQCSSIVHQNITEVESTDKNNQTKASISDTVPQITYDTSVSKVLILILCVVYFITIFIGGYGLHTTWRPFQLTPFVILSIVTLACLVYCAVAMYLYKDTMIVMRIVMTIFTALMLGTVVLLIYFIFTHEISEECYVYNEQYDKRLYSYLNAAAKGDMKEIKRLKNEDYIEMEDVDYDNRSALHLAACENQIDVVKYILSHHFCFPAATDRWNRTALADIEFHEKNKPDKEVDYTEVKNKINKYKFSGHEKKHFKEKKAVELIKAAQKGDIEKIKRLHKRNTDMNLQDSSGQTALHAAAKNGTVNIVTYLLEECKVSPFVRARGKRPLDIVPHEESEENKKVRELLNKNMKKLREAQIDDMDCIEQIDCSDHDLTIVRLLNSAARGDLLTMRKLQKSGCEMDARDYDQRTALHIAVSENQEYIVEFLLEKCKQQNIAMHFKDRWNMTPFEESKKKDGQTVYNMMLKHCQGLVDTENDEYHTCLLLNAAKNRDVTELKRLHKEKVDMNLRDYGGRTALHIAAAEDNVDAVGFLVKIAKVAVSIPDRDNRLPIEEAKNQDIKEIIRKGENNPKQTTELTYADKTLTMVMKAAAKGLLCKLKDDDRYTCFKMDSCDYFKDTPLHLSATKGRLNDVKYLLNECKVSPFVRNSLWKMPIDLVNEKIKLWMEKEEINETLRRKSPRKVFENVKIELENAMKKAIEDDVNKDLYFEKLDQNLQTFLFLNKASKGDIRAIRSYLKTNSELLNTVNYDRRSALHIAVAEGHQELVNFLKKNKADVEIEDRWGNKPEADTKQA